MKESRFWLTSFFFSVFIHFSIIAVLAFSAGDAPNPANKETIAVSIELLNLPPAPPEPAKPEKLREEPRPVFSEPKKDIPPVQKKPIVSPAAKAVQTPVISPNAEIAQPPSLSAPPADSADGAVVGQGAATEGTPANNGGGTGTKVSKGGGKPDKKAYPIYAPMPEYPVDARTDKIEGKVYIRVFLDKNGKVQEAQITKSSGSSSLDQAALNCLLKWKFAPTYRNGIPVADRLIVPVVFNMKQR